MAKNVLLFFWEKLGISIVDGNHFELSVFEVCSSCTTCLDPRTKNWFLVENFYPTLTLTCMYLLTVWQLPKFMRDREPLQLSKFMVVYNLALVVLNFHICSEVGTKLNALESLKYRNQQFASFSIFAHFVLFSSYPAKIRLESHLEAALFRG